MIESYRAVPVIFYASLFCSFLERASKPYRQERYLVICEISKNETQVTFSQTRSIFQWSRTRSSFFTMLLSLTYSVNMIES